MATTLQQRGSRYSWTNNTGSDVPQNSVVVLNSGSTGFIGIALADIPSALAGELIIGGPDECVHVLTKHTGEAFTDAQPMYWDNTNKRLTGASTGNTRCGRAFGPAATAATTASFIINQ